VLVRVVARKLREGADTVITLASRMCIGDIFLEWDGFGMVPDAEETTQHWVRARLLDTYGHKSQQD